MKKIKIVLFILIILSIILIPLKINASSQTQINPDAYYSKGPSASEVKDMYVYGGRVVGIIQIVGTIVSAGTLIIIGIRYVIASVDEKAEYKERMVPYVIGAVLLFGASNIVNIGYKIIDGFEKPPEVVITPKPEKDEEEDDDPLTDSVTSGNNKIQSAQGWIWEGAEGEPPKEKIPSGYTGSFRSWYGAEYHEYWDPDKDGDIDMDDFDLVAGDWDYRQGVIAKMPDSCYDHDGNGLDSGDGDYWYEYKTHYKILASEVDRRLAGK